MVAEKLQEFVMLAVYDFLAVSAGNPVRATMRRQQVFRNRNLRRLLNNLDEDRITIREFLISTTKGILLTQPLR